ncbi:MAG: hypothetical protein FD144_4718 [Rhodospirillaceae bacterium]|nr:MAG: hypothetical protein FD144_4718 [Rhodospirillaceae bacterium]
MNLPAPVRTYFDADKGPPDRAPLTAFAPNAVVEDEGHTHVGHAAIEAWWRASKAQYEATAEPLDVREEQDRIIVRAKVTGAFPGSPIVLAFSFRLMNGQITDLRIGA